MKKTIAVAILVLTLIAGVPALGGVAAADYLSPWPYCFEAKPYTGNAVDIDRVRVNGPVVDFGTGCHFSGRPDKKAYIIFRSVRARVIGSLYVEGGNCGRHIIEFWTRSGRYEVGPSSWLCNKFPVGVQRWTFARSRYDPRGLVLYIKIKIQSRSLSTSGTVSTMTICRNRGDSRNYGC